MQSVAVVALALLESVQAFQAPALKASTRSVALSMFSEGDLGVLPPLGGRALGASFPRSGWMPRRRCR